MRLYKKRSIKAFPLKSNLVRQNATIVFTKVEVMQEKKITIRVFLNMGVVVEFYNDIILPIMCKIITYFAAPIFYYPIIGRMISRMIMKCRFCLFLK